MSSVGPLFETYLRATHTHTHIYNESPYICAYKVRLKTLNAKRPRKANEASHAGSQHPLFPRCAAGSCRFMVAAGNSLLNQIVNKSQAIWRKKPAMFMEYGWDWISSEWSKVYEKFEVASFSRWVADVCNISLTIVVAKKYEQVGEKFPRTQSELYISSDTYSYIHVWKAEKIKKK